MPIQFAPFFLSFEIISISEQQSFRSETQTQVWMAPIAHLLDKEADATVLTVDKVEIPVA